MFTKTYEYVIHALQTTHFEIIVMKEKLMIEKNIEEAEDTKENIDYTTTILDPPSSKCKGRLRNRYKWA